jgi:putative hydrolase of the HAD superfamily
MRGLIVDIGGVLVTGGLLDVAQRWAVQLGIAQSQVLDAVYGGNDDTVLIGRVTEDEWWSVVQGRLGVDCAALRDDLESNQVWDMPLVDAVRATKHRARTAILSNAWPSQHTVMRQLAVDDVVHEVLLSCDIGYAKPDLDAFRVALERLGTEPGDTLFVDDTPGHVEAAAALGIRVHVHTDRATTIDAIERHLTSGS